ncbi:tetratricopeptide repeat protein [Deinococcus depolymerans]|uniref:Tetratricopeptide repeat protein n=1 Tax=Deinococcus depolymerans TaxID=392408 RepID=A0ABN1CJX3_9DEIO
MSGPAVPTDRPVSLVELIGAGDWSRARGAARAQGAPLDLEEALDAALAFRDELRARRYPAVRRALADLTRLLPLLTGEEGVALRAALDAPALSVAVEALERSQKITEPDAMAAALAGALALPATRAEALNQQGVLLAVLGEPDRAREVLEAALQADPGHYRALTNLGNLDMEAGRYAQAEAIYRRVLILNPEYDGGHHNLGVALRRQGRVAEGVRSIRQGQRLSMKRSKTDTEAEMKEQFARSPAMRNLRWVLLAVAALIVFLAVRGVG